MSFFAELGFTLPQFPFIAHSRGWTAEDMEQNIAEVQQSEELREGARALVERAVRLPICCWRTRPGPARLRAAAAKRIGSKWNVQSSCTACRQ